MLFMFRVDNMTQGRIENNGRKGKRTEGI
uniref:Uncharacterized protein n=1 Tax=Rhizophora mucronata TaxID=61149 RepID=A0A2P2PAT0_RHIMU